jgi:hypothetical protein
MRLKIQIAATLLVIFLFCQVGMGAKDDNKSEPYNYFRDYVGLNAEQIQSISNGKALAKVLDTGSADQILVFGAVRAVASPPGHQFQSPAIRRSAGPITIRTSVASINTAIANVNPIILTTRKSPKVNAANTTIMIAAALVIRPAVLAIPSGIASISLSPLLLASRTRATRNTS